MHGRTAFLVTLSQEDDTVRVAVRDDAAWIERPAGAPDAVLRGGGRGLVIVNVLSRDWGVITGESSKTVWATFDTVEVVAS